MPRVWVLWDRPRVRNPRPVSPYVAPYPDGIGPQPGATADYGTNGGTALSRPTTIPARADTCLVTSSIYDWRATFSRPPILQAWSPTSATTPWVVRSSES